MTACNIEFSGEQSLAKSVAELAQFYCRKKEIKGLENSVLLLLSEENQIAAKCDAVVMPHELCTDELRLTAKSNSQKIITYSLENFSADFVALNKQVREDNVSFELMVQSSLARIFIANGKTFTIEQVLPAAAALYAGGESLGDIVEAFNSLLK